MSIKTTPTLGCPCCDNYGAIPQQVAVPVNPLFRHHQVAGVGRVVPGDVVKLMCDGCMLAAFLSNGTHPHPHQIAGRS